MKEQKGEGREMAAKQQDQQTQAGGHQEVGHKSLLQSDALYQVKIRSHRHPSVTNV